MNSKQENQRDVFSFHNEESKLLIKEKEIFGKSWDIEGIIFNSSYYYKELGLRFATLVKLVFLVLLFSKSNALELFDWIDNSLVLLLIILLESIYMELSKKLTRFVYLFMRIILLCFIISIVFLEKDININLLKNHQIEKGRIMKHHNFGDGNFLGYVFACANEIITQGRSYSQTSISVSNCFFQRSAQYNGMGGVIYTNGASYSIVISSSMFSNCVSSDRGGAICLYDSSKSYLSKICAYKCSCGSTVYGNFGYLRATLNNQVEYLSISSCSHTSSGYYPFSLMSGSQKEDLTNCSLNRAVISSGISIQSPTSYTSSFCTYSNNIASDCNCIEFYDKSGLKSYSNIIYNNSPSKNGVVLVYGKGSYQMQYCVLYMNQNTLFCIYEGSLEISHSFIYHDGTLSTSTPLVTPNNNSFTMIRTYQINFFNSHYCNTDNIEKTLNLALIESTRKTHIFFFIIILFI